MQFRRSLLIAKLALCVGLMPTAHAATPSEPPKEPVQHEFVIKNFKTESGTVLPEARIVYGTYGKLNAKGDNAVLLPSHYMAEMHGYGFVIGPGNALDPTKLFLITSELFGNGRSSSPSNTPEPYHGPRFPITTIRDNVNAVHQMLTEQLHVKHLRAIIGFSMGAQQAFQWAVSYPDYMDRIVATSGTAKTYGHGIVRLESEIFALATDPVFKGGDYTEQPTRGIQAFSIVWTGWLFSQEWWRRELWRSDESMGDVEAALRSIKVPVLYMPSQTDLYFPVADATYESAFIPHGTLDVIPSLWGHPAGAGASPADAKYLNEHIAKFME